MGIMLEHARQIDKSRVNVVNHHQRDVGYHPLVMTLEPIVPLEASQVLLDDEAAGDDARVHAFFRFRRKR